MLGYKLGWEGGGGLVSQIRAPAQGNPVFQSCELATALEHPSLQLGANTKAPRIAALVWAEASGRRDREVFAIPRVCGLHTAHLSPSPACLLQRATNHCISFHDVAKGTLWLLPSLPIST